MILCDSPPSAVFHANSPCHRLEVILGQLIDGFGGAGSLGLSTVGLGHVLLGFVASGGCGGLGMVIIIGHGLN